MHQSLCVLGSVNVDYVLQVADFPKAGETIVSQDMQVVYGGKGANQAVAAARLGAKAHFIACVGDDASADSMISAFAADGIATAAVMRIADCQTGLALIQVSAAGENSIVIVAGANAALTPEKVDLHQDVIAQSPYLLLQLESPLASVQHAARLAKAAGTKVVLNPAPAQTLTPELLALVDIITPNESETETLTGIAVTDEASASRAAQCFHNWGIASVIITMGAKGVYLSTAEQKQFFPAFAVTARDSTAAGDTFNGALLCALLEEKSWTEAIRFAQAAAAISVTRLGAQTAIPRRAEVDAFLEQ